MRKACRNHHHVACREGHVLAILAAKSQNGLARMAPQHLMRLQVEMMPVVNAA